MSQPRHSIPEKTFFALAAGGGGPEAISHLLPAQRSKRLLLLKAVCDTAVEAGHPGAEQARSAYSLLAQIERSNPEAVAAVLHYPTVGAWARRTLLAVSEGDAARPEEFAALAAAAAIRADHPCTIEVPARDGAVVLPSLGRALVPGRASAVVRVSPDGADVARVRVPDDPHQDAPGWDALRRLNASYQSARVDFLLDDHNPDRMPGARNLTERLREDELDYWRSMLDEAWRILVTHHWTTAAEVTASISVLTPMIPPSQGLSSATPRDAYGNIGLSRPPDPHYLAVTFAHEVQHTKLNALLDVVALTKPDDGSRYYAPWRDDPRPATGLLQGTYAHLGIAGFWRRIREHAKDALALRADSDFARWRDATDLGARILMASGRLTPEGEAFVAELRRTMVPWIAESVSAQGLARAQESAEEHLARWRLAHGEPPLL